MSLIQLGIFAAALIGSGVAALADLLQKNTAGAVVKLQTTLAILLDLNLQTIWAILILMVLGTALCFVFQPQTRQAGFAVGLSVISVIMTATPTRPPSSPAGIAIGGHIPSSMAGTYALLQWEHAGTSDWPILRIQGQANLLRLNFEVSIKESPSRPLGVVTIRVRELPSGQIWQWKTNQFERQSNFPVLFFYDVPASTNAVAVEARIEAENYNAATVQGRVISGKNQVKLGFSLEKSALPSVIKGLFEQRSF